MSQKPYNIINKKVQILRGKNGLNFKHRKAQKLILSGRFDNLYGNSQDWCHIWETPCS